MEELFSYAFWLNLYEQFTDWIIKEGLSLIALIIFTFIGFQIISFLTPRIKRLMLKRIKKKNKTDVFESEKRINTLIGIIKGLCKITLWIIFIMLFLNKIGFNIAPLLASAGILGLAVGFGAQELIRDFISGFFILLENQIRIDDVAIINGTIGSVQSIELRTTTLRDFSGVVHIFQNGKINTLSNMTKDWSAILVEIGVDYREDADTVIHLMEKVGKELENIPEIAPNLRGSIEVYGIDKFLDSALLFKARIKTKPSKQWEIAREYRKRIKKTFDENNISIPFPHTTFYWGSESDAMKIDVIQNKNNLA